MTINRRIMTRTLARQTGLTQPQVEDLLEKLIDLWKEELIAGGRIIRMVKIRVAKNVKLEINKYTRPNTDE